MRKALLITLLLGAVAVGVGAWALHRYDAGRADRIAEGVTVAGIDVGGLELADARATVARRVERALERPLTLRYERRRFTVDPGLVDVETNGDLLLRRALAESREGNFLTRGLRDLTGRGLDVDLALDVDYSSEAVARVVTGVKRAVDRPSREAKSAVSFGGVRITPSRTGVAVRAGALRDAIARRLVRPGAARTLAVPVRHVEPKVTTKDLTSRFRYFIAISRGRKELRLFVGRELAKTYRVGIGAVGFETPAGLYEVETKAGNPAWYVPNRPWAGDLAGKVIPAGDPDNPIKARWMGFWNGAGIHGTADEASIGTSASHGCIRMTVPDVIDLYDRVPLHTPLYIA